MLVRDRTDHALEMHRNCTGSALEPPAFPGGIKGTGRTSSGTLTRAADSKSAMPTIPTFPSLCRREEMAANMSYFMGIMSSTCTDALPEGSDAK
jgi:hypothetical protein